MNRTLAILFVLLLPAVTTRLYASDEIQYFSFLRSFWFDGDLSFQNEYEALQTRGVAVASGFRETNLERATSTGHPLNFGTIGCAILWSPFYGIGHLTALGMRAMGSSVPLDGYSTPYVAAVCYGSALYGFLAVLLAERIARRLVGHAGGAPLAVWFGTPLLFYMYLAPVFAHACAAFTVAVFTWAWIRIREQWTVRGFAALGALAAVMTMVREQDAFFVAGPAVDMLLTTCRREHAARLPVQRLAIGVAVAAVTGLVVAAPQLWAYLYLNGRLGPPDVVERKMSWSAPHFFEVLFSPDHGLFFWTPLALLAVGGLIYLLFRPTPRDSRPIVLGLAIMFLCQVYVSGSVESWTVAGAFGQRRFVSLTTILIVGLAGAWRLAAAWPTAARASAAGVVALCIWWNLGLMFQFGTNTMDRQRLHIVENARRSFIELPRTAPALAWRYFTDRSSFYRKPAP